MILVLDFEKNLDFKILKEKRENVVGITHIIF